MDSKVVVIVDFENYQAIPTDLLNKDYIYYLFCGFVTTKPAQEYKGMLEGYDINIVETKHIGTNIVDNRISMYIDVIYLVNTILSKLYWYLMILIIMK